jgi:hypothetical protein
MDSGAFRHLTRRHLRTGVILRAMADGSMRRGGPNLVPLLLAVIFLAVLGGGVGFSLGTLAKHQRNAAATQADHGTQTGNTGQDNGTGQGNGSGGGNGAGTGGGQNGKKQCLDHTVAQANAGALTQLLYLHTAQSEVWVCKDSNGTLYYQGHRGQPGEDLVEGSNALFLTTIQREGGNGYVATNTDQAGRITEYHITPTQLVIKFRNYQPPKATQTEDAVG